MINEKEGSVKWRKKNYKNKRTQKRNVCVMKRRGTRGCDRLTEQA